MFICRVSERDSELFEHSEVAAQAVAADREIPYKTRSNSISVIFLLASYPGGPTTILSLSSFFALL